MNIKILSASIVIFLLIVILCIPTSGLSPVPPTITCDNYSEYCELLDTDTPPSDFISYDMLSFIGTFKSFDTIVMYSDYSYLLLCNNDFDLHISVVPIQSNENYSYDEIDSYYESHYRRSELFNTNKPLTSTDILHRPEWISDTYTVVSSNNIHYKYDTDGNLTSVSVIVNNNYITFEPANENVDFASYDLLANDFVGKLLGAEMTGERINKLINGEETLVTTPEATTPEEQPKSGCAAFSFALPAFSALLSTPIIIFIRKRKL